MDPFFFSGITTSYDQAADEIHNWGSSFDPALDLHPDSFTGHIPPPLAKLSAFSRYDPRILISSPQWSSGLNIHRRVIELLRSIRRSKQEGSKGERSDASRGFRHMMRERQRRERLSQSYADLYALLCHPAKADKNSIVQTAAALLSELKGVKEGLRKRNEELMRADIASSSAIMEGMGAAICDRKTEAEVAKEVIMVRMKNSTSSSAVDSVIDALRCLKSLDLKARAIRAEFSGGGTGNCGVLDGVMTIESETIKGNRALDVQMAMERMLSVQGWR